MIRSDAMYAGVEPIDMRAGAGPVFVCRSSVPRSHTIAPCSRIPFAPSGFRLECENLAVPYVFETSQVDGVFIARVGGERRESAEDFEALFNFWASVALRMREADLHRLLAVASASGTFRKLDLPSAFYRRLGAMGFQSNVRIAVVTLVVAHELPMLQLGVGIAKADGWTIAQFKSEAEGLEWLREEGDAETKVTEDI